MREGEEARPTHAALGRSVVELFHFRSGATPLIVSMPHTGTFIPEAILQRLTPAARALPDTDWHLERLYDFLDELGASVLAATHSRYVVDLNRPPSNENLYPGQDTTGVVPTDTFAKEPLYVEPSQLEQAEAPKRIEAFWQPYHVKLKQELDAIQQRHGYVLLWDAHSILSRVPRFFSGRLPDFNLGTAEGKSCGQGLGERLHDIARRAHRYSAVLNGRFKGGYITRHYGAPARRVHAVQLELAEVTYMEELAPFAFRKSRAAKVRPHLKGMLEAMLDWGATRG